jgi:hypothetical protein
MVAQADGSMSFYYEYTRPVVTLPVPPISHEYSTKDPPEAGSDAIIYGVGDVFTLQYIPFALTKGLATRLIRIPNIDVGALEVAHRMLDRLYESRGRHDITCRPNLSVQAADQLDFSWQQSGTETLREFSIIVENVKLSISFSGTKNVQFSIGGRNTLA